jgi:hypothetical protein
MFSGIAAGLRSAGGSRRRPDAALKSRFPRIAPRVDRIHAASAK